VEREPHPTEPVALVVKDAHIAELEARVTELSAQNAKLAEQNAKLAEQNAELLRLLGADSGNSNKPPSSDPPANRAARRAKKAGKDEERRKRGGQTGHRGTRRTLVPVEEVDAVVDLYPDECESCWKHLPQVVDENARRYQQVDLAPLGRHIIEWRRHAVTCPCCGYRTRAKYDGDIIPSSPFGPRLVAVVALLTGSYHLSRRKTVDLLRELLGVVLSLGSVSNIEARASAALKAPVDEACERAKTDAVKHTDGTSWYQAGALKSLWTIATTAVTVFAILDDGKGETLKPLFGKRRGVLVSDRATALKFWLMKWRQICWAHLLRKFISFSERDGPAGDVGKELTDYVGIIFANWHEYKDGKLTRAELKARMDPVRKNFEAALERAVAAKIRGVSGSCADMLDHRGAFWNFVDKKGVEPTNNHAEQALRAFVLWRKRSFGTQSERGNLFAVRVMTVVDTARKQRKNVLDFLTNCCAAMFTRRDAPSLLTA
jgi:transposase